MLGLRSFVFEIITFMRISNWFIKTVMVLSLILIVFCLLVIIAIGLGFLKVFYYVITTEVLTYASVMMATANALLLFATLSYQNRIYRHERFEETLFNLLDNHRKIKNDIQIVVDDEPSIEPY